jgi:branched-chain amino acid transport system permease protein
LMFALRTLIYHSRMGRAMRAVSHRHDVAALMGINVDATISLTFMIGSALAGAAGVLVGLTYPKIDPLMGVMFGLKAFVAAVVGGIGNVSGAVVGALVLGISEAMVIGYWSSTYRDALAFGVLIIILLVKPTGLFGSTQLEKV